MTVTSISASLTDSLSRVGSPSLVEQAQFERALAQAAPSMKNDAASELARVAPVAPPMDVQRAVSQTSPLGHRVQQMFSSMFPDNTVTSAAPNEEVALTRGALTGSAQKRAIEDGAASGTSGVPQAGQDFGTMVAGLRDIYNGVTQVALVSKGISGVTSSVNKLIKEG
ncbi:nodulation protein NolB [Mesorhizobium tamadayense]|nr:nodulation protein NolB [Mesorhizobium tamadayense]